MIEPIAKPDHPEYVVQVADHIQLLDVRLVRTRCNVEQVALTELPDETKQAVEATYKLDKHNHRLQVQVSFALDVRRSASPDADAPVRIQATFLLVYAVDQGTKLNKAQYEAFASVNSVFNAWPYWREFVQSMTVRMGLPALTLPVFRIRSAPAHPPGVPAEAGPPRV